MKNMKREIQEKVLDEIMAMMDSEEGEELKKHSPKFMKVETNDPEVAQKLMKPEDSEESQDEESEEEPQSSDEDDEDQKRLRELYSRLK